AIPCHAVGSRRDSTPCSTIGRRSLAPCSGDFLCCLEAWGVLPAPLRSQAAGCGVAGAKPDRNAYLPLRLLEVGAQRERSGLRPPMISGQPIAENQATGYRE